MTVTSIHSKQIQKKRDSMKEFVRNIVELNMMPEGLSELEVDLQRRYRAMYIALFDFTTRVKWKGDMKIDEGVLGIEKYRANINLSLGTSKAFTVSYAHTVFKDSLGIQNIAAGQWEGVRADKSENASIAYDELDINIGFKVEPMAYGESLPPRILTVQMEFAIYRSLAQAGFVKWYKKGKDFCVQTFMYENDSVTMETFKLDTDVYSVTVNRGSSSMTY